jgi:hypothetical protein
MRIRIWIRILYFYLIRIRTRLVTLTRIRIQFPKMMRGIHADPDPHTGWWHILHADLPAGLGEAPPGTVADTFNWNWQCQWLRNPDPSVIKQK